mmetsp:Transcript_40101/g.95194  ORF Transcript_40101/g.95194 Transcript_40101/m.95194 type:complete len:431 (+) Transcript_40101:159-1451(+)
MIQQRLLAGVLLQTVFFGICVGFSPQLLSKPAARTTSNRFSPTCSLRKSRPLFPRQSKRRPLTTTSFQASEVVAKPPEVDMTFRPRAERVIALGDVHGDLYALDSALMLSDLMDDKGRWIGEKAILVQMGDILDRGPDESDCLQRLLSLQAQARAVGGDVIMLLGNHEIMNADLDFRYVEPLGWVGWDFDESREEAMMKKFAMREKVGYPPVSGYMLPRIQALERGRGALAEIMAKMPVAVTIGETVFIHGGLVPEVVVYGLKRMNEETAEWLSGHRDHKPWVLDNCRVRGLSVNQEVSPLWHRAVGREEVEEDALAEVDGAMRLLGAKRLVVGHTPQMRGVNCVQTQEGREIWRVDTGMSEGILSGQVETLEILAGKRGEEEKVHVLHADGAHASHHRVSQRARGPAWKKELGEEEEEEALKMPVLSVP